MKDSKLKQLVKYQEVIKQKLEDSTPAKHSSHPETYKAYLANEMRIVTDQINAIKLKA